MKKLKLVDLKLKFNTSYNVHPIVIKYKGTTVENEVNILLDQVDQKEYVQFSGFDQNDKDQSVTCSIFYNEVPLEINQLCSFEMKNNMYVDNIRLFDNAHKIYFNGDLELKFFKEWIQHNLLSGACLNDKKTDYIHWTTGYEPNQIDRNRYKPLKHYDIICIGASMVHGTKQLDKSKAWPSQIQNMLNLTVGNFGVEGNDHFGVMHNIEYVIKNFNVKKIIALLPASYILPKRIRFLNKYVFLFCSVGVKRKSLLFSSEEKAWQKKNILKGRFIKKFLSKKLKKVEQMCADKNVNLSLIYHNIPDRNFFNYNSTRFKNFGFPEYTPKQSLENKHPDETVHFKFAKTVVENI